MAIPSNSLPPARGCRVDRTSKQFLDRAETGEPGALPGASGIKSAKFHKHRQISIESRIEYKRYDGILLMGF
jgi:hypothetical protein